LRIAALLQAAERQEYQEILKTLFHVIGCNTMQMYELVPVRVSDHP